MNSAGSNSRKQPGPPLWLLAELTYRCPLQCPYCSNPVNFAALKDELPTEDWLRVMAQARQLGAAQLGFSGGEPLVRQDLETLVAEGRKLGYYSNLITSGMGLSDARVGALKEAGLDHIQLSFQASSEDTNNFLAGSRKAFDQKKKIAAAVKAQGYPMVLNFVLHRHNIDFVDDILELSAELGADYVELANAQYYGWALHNRLALMPTGEQLRAAEKTTNAFRAKYPDKMKIFFIIPDYFETRPKACMNGWGSVFLTIAPDGMALPCHSARELPIEFPNVRNMNIADIWYQSQGFNHYRGDDWMQEPCRSCPEKSRDFGGCRCQAYLLTGDAANADPVCDKSPQHAHVLETVAQAGHPESAATPLLFRNSGNSQTLIANG